MADMFSGVKVSNEAIENAVVASIAGQILQGIGAEHRDAIMQRSIEEALKSWSVRNAVEKAVALRAAEIAADLCRTDEWGKRIEETLRAGFEAYLASVKKGAMSQWAK
jgi:hypothetical protein